MPNKILIDDLVEHKWSCPFDREALNSLMADSVAIKEIREFKILCVEKLHYLFSSPGNSFERKLINMLNRKYQLDKYNGLCDIRELCETNKEWLIAYDTKIDSLREKAGKIRFRKLDSEYRHLYHLTENEIINLFYSNILNEEGIITTYKTFVTE